MRYVLLDRITALCPPDRATGIKCVSLSDDVFADHFPGLPVVPGALIVESMAQLAGVLLEAGARLQGREDLYAVLAMVECAKFRRAVVPGDRIELEATTVAHSEDGGRIHVEARVDCRIVTEADLTLALRPLRDERVVAQRQELLRIWCTKRGEDD